MLKSSGVNFILVSFFIGLCLLIYSCKQKLPPIPEGAPENYPHHWSLKDRCVDCHNNKDRTLKEPLKALCDKCHTGMHKNDSHPVNVKVNEKELADKKLPLKDGKITCITCHDPHGKTGLKGILRKPFDDLCLSCHDY